MWCFGNHFFERKKYAMFFNFIFHSRGGLLFGASWGWWTAPGRTCKSRLDGGVPGWGFVFCPHDALTWCVYRFLMDRCNDSVAFTG